MYSSRSSGLGRISAARWLLAVILSIPGGGIAGDGTGADCNRNGIPDEQDLRAGDLILQSARRFPAGDAPVAIAAGDLDGDLDIDLVTANRDSSDVSVLLNRGDGSFSAPTGFSAGAEPVAVALAGLDADADLDIAVASRGSEDGGLSVLLNLGGGAYARRVPLSGAPTPNSVAAGDIDGDGDVDLVAADDALGIVALHENDGAGGFGDGESHDLGEEPTSVVVADFDRDGRLDIAALTSHGSPATLAYDASVLFNEGEGTFAEPLHFGAAESPHSIIATDVDGDSNPDLVISDQSNSPFIEHVVILENIGNRTFASGKYYEAGFGPAGLAAGDLEGDGDADLAVATLRGIAVLRNPFPAGPAESPIFAGNRPVAVAAADFDRDGDLDLASANSDSDDVSILLNRGGASFPTPGLFKANTVEGPDSGDAAFVLAGDFDGDADVDIVTASERADASLIRNVGNRLLTQERLDGIGPSATAADLDRDADLDIVLASADSKALLVLLNSGSGAFAEPASFAAGESPVAAAAADLDGDEDIDLAAADAASSQLAVLLNDGTGTFGPAVMLDVGSSPASVTAADLDGDGDADLASADSGANGVSVLRSEGGTFELARSHPAGEKPVSVAPGDLDGDGDLDLVTADEGSHTVSVFLNDGHGAFAPRVALMTGRSPVSVALGDIDGDTDLDVISGDGGSDGVSIFRNDGSGTFDEAIRFSCASSVRCVATADLDRNGVPDIIAVNTPIRRESDEVEDYLSVLWNETAPPSSGDIDRNGVPDECESRAVSALAAPPDPIIIEDGAKAVAFAGMIVPGSLVEDLVWNGAVFENVGHRDASRLVTSARLYSDTNGDGALDGGDLPIGSGAAFDPATQRVTFENLAEPLVPGDPEAMLLVLDLADTTDGTMGLSLLPGDGASVLALVAGAITAICLRRRGRLRRTSWVLALFLLALLVAPSGCGADGGGGEESELKIRLETLDVEGAESGLPAAIEGLPLTAWPIDP